MIPLEWGRFGVKSTLQCWAGLCGKRIYNISLWGILMDLCKATRQSLSMMDGALGILQEFHSQELRVSEGLNVGFLPHRRDLQQTPLLGEDGKYLSAIPQVFS